MEPVSVNPNQPYLEGQKVEINENYGGLGAHFLETLLENLDKIHQIDTVTGITETNGSVRSRAIQTAHELLHFGITENDIALICCRGHADQTVVVLACLLIGCIVAPIDSEFHHKECIDLLGQLKPKICFCDLRSLKQMERVVAETGINSSMVHFGEPQQQSAFSFRKLLLNRKYPEEFKPIQIGDPKKHVAFIMATQGATGPPKLVCLSHHFIYSQMHVLLDVMRSPDKIISYYPLSWVMQVILMCLCFKTPVCRVLTGKFVERTACKMIQDLKVDHAFLNTELAIQLAEHAAVRDFDIRCLRSVFIGSLTTTSHDIKILVRRIHKTRFMQIYCTTETGIAISPLPESYRESLECIGTVGKAVQNCKIRIVDLNTREDVEPDIAGELLIGANCMMLGYFKNMNSTKSSLQDGYFKTGDIARYDNCGWIFIEGRLADLIEVNGVLESPRELENIIMMHPFVRDTAVIGNFKEIVACVILKNDKKLDEDTLLSFISDKLPVEKWPTRVVFMSDFPTTPLGKIKKDVLKQEILNVKIEHSHTVIIPSK